MKNRRITFGLFSAVLICLLSGCGEDNAPKEFMTQKEAEAAVAAQEKFDAESKAKEEYVEEHEIELTGEYPFEVFETCYSLYDIVDTMGVFDDYIADDASYIYNQASYSGLDGQLSLTFVSSYSLIYNSSNDKVRTATWEYSGKENEKCEQMLEEWITLFENQYGEYEKRSYEHSDLLKNYPGVQYMWGNSNPDYLLDNGSDWIRLDYLDKGSSCTLSIEKFYHEQKYSAVEEAVVTKLIGEETFVSNEEAIGLNPYAPGNEKICYAYYAYTGEPDLTRVWNGSFVGTDGTKIKLDVIDYSSSENIEVYGTVTLYDNKYADSIETTFDSSIDDFLLYAYSGFYSAMAPDREDIEYQELSIESLQFDFFLSDDMNTLYVLQRGYGIRNYTGIYQREEAVDASWFYELGKQKYKDFVPDGQMDEYGDIEEPEENYDENSIEIEIAEEQPDVLELAGFYQGSDTIYDADINIFSSPEDEIIGNAAFSIIPDNIGDMAYFVIEQYLVESYLEGIEYPYPLIAGELVQKDTNVYTLKGQPVEIIVSYYENSTESRILTLTLVVDGYYMGQCFQMEHYES